MDQPTVTGALPAVLAVDGGNSKTDMALVGADGSVLAQIRGPGVPLRLSRDTVRLLDSLARSIAPAASAQPAAAAAADPQPPPAGLIARHMVACMANVDLPDEEQWLDEMLRAQGWSRTVDVANDTLAVLRAGLGGRLPAGLPGHPGPGGRGPARKAAEATGPHGAAADRTGPDGTAADGRGPDGTDPDRTGYWGVAITCGAGINGVGVAPDSRTTRFLALGTLTGDWGGGEGLARAVMWWAARAEDGRGPRTALCKAVTAHFGVSEVRDVAIGVHLGTIAEPSLLGLVPRLFEVSRQGDRVARRLVHRLGDEIVTMTITAIRRLGLSRAAVPVVLGGGILTARDPLLTERIAAGLAAGAPGAVMRITDLPPIAGAALLGLDHVAGPRTAHARLAAAYLGLSASSPARGGPAAGSPAAGAASEGPLR